MSDINTGRPQDQRGIGVDDLQEKAVEQETVTNDAVAGETVLPGVALDDDVDLRTGGATDQINPPDRVEPIYDEHDRQTEEPVQLGDEPDDDSDKG
ncbi:hypothetical protein [Cryobacterium tepidiphilum]|jgi:hypothetical protein|uniref:hypothetical protein n=1 Tax=Cryobacterium tepidiphilum TaxID=2486026 RepID=UPI0018F6C7D1|nr:hypothetical protein [Cryobacterium tepidiphilum]